MSAQIRDVAVSLASQTSKAVALTSHLVSGALLLIAGIALLIFASRRASAGRRATTIAGWLIVAFGVTSAAIPIFKIFAITVLGTGVIAAFQ